YPSAIAITSTVGLSLIFFSSDVFLTLAQATNIQLFADIYFNNYLFIRLGDVFIVFALFMLFRHLMTHSTALKIGQSTLSIYIVHFIVLYGSFTGLGLYRFFNHALPPSVAVPGAIVFMIGCTYAALQYEKNKERIQLNISTGLRYLWIKTESWQSFIFKLIKTNLFRAKLMFLKLFRLAKN
ncbi:MAG: hypothetical protein WBG90_07425, partial [Saonia sp.]